LSLPLIDIMGKPQLILDPKNISFAKTFKVGVWFSRKPKPLPDQRAEKNSGGNVSSKSHLDKIALRLKVRLRGVLELLLQSVKDGRPPVPSNILAFLEQLVLDGATFPEHYLFRHERKALRFTELGETRWMLPIEDEVDGKLRYDLSRIKLVLGNFVVTRCLLPTLLRPWEGSMGGRRPERKVCNNLIMLTTLMHVIFQSIAGGPDAGSVDPKAKRDGDIAAQGVAKLRRMSSSFNSKSKILPSTAEPGPIAADSARTTASALESARSAEPGQRRFPSAYDYASLLYPAKHYAIMKGRLGFLDDLKETLDLVLLQLLRKSLEETPPNLIPGLLDQLDEEIAISEKRHGISDGRVIVLRKVEEEVQRSARSARKEEEAAAAGASEPSKPLLPHFEEDESSPSENKVNNTEPKQSEDKAAVSPQNTESLQEEDDNKSEASTASSKRPSTGQPEDLAPIASSTPKLSAEEEEEADKNRGSPVENRADSEHLNVPPLFTKTSSLRSLGTKKEKV